MSENDPSGQVEDSRAKAYSQYVSTHTAPPDRKIYKSQTQWFPVLRHIPADRGLRVLDLGCGDGSLLKELLALGYKNIYGIDTSSEQIASARLRGIDCVEAADAFGFLKSGGANRWDVILLVDVLEHFSIDEAVQVFELVEFALAPDGTVIAQSPNSTSPFFGRYAYGDLTHRSVYTESSAKQLARLAGLTPVAVHAVPVAPGGGPGRAARRVAFHVVKKLYQFALSAESGPQMNAVVSQNLILEARKIQGIKDSYDT